MAAMGQEAAAMAAEALVQDAKKKLNSFSFFGINKQQKWEDAAELYGKAAAKFRLAKMPKEAGDCYVEAAKLSEKCNNDTDATKFYTDAAKCYRDHDPREALKFFEVAVNKQVEQNKFSVAAKLYKDIAEMHETDGKTTEAIEAYKRSAECHEMAEAYTTANQSWLKVADFSAQANDFKTAIDIYERVSKQSADNALTKWSVPQYLFKALLCQFVVCSKVGNIQELKEKMENYRDLFPQFERQREYALIDKTSKAFEEKSLEKFTDAVHEFDQISPLDNWKASLLLEVKNGLKMAPLAALENFDAAPSSKPPAGVDIT